jgi:hypothetical protein
MQASMSRARARGPILGLLSYESVQQRLYFAVPYWQTMRPCADAILVPLARSAPTIAMVASVANPKLARSRM